MATKIDFSSVFDTVVPNIYIRKVSLLPSTQAGERRSIHYDEDEVYDFQKDSFGKPIIGSNKKRFRGAGTDPRGLAISIDFVIKDAIRENKRPYWFNNEEALNKIKARIVLCSDADIARRFERRGFNPKTLRHLRQTSKIREKIIDIRKNSFSSLKDHREERIGGRRVYSMEYNVSFSIADFHPKHLSVYAHTFIDLDLAASRRSRVITSKRGYLQGNTAAETIISRGTVKKEGHVFLLPGGKLWAGPVHYHKEKGYMAGAFHHARISHPILNRKKVPNLVVEDHRLLNRAKNAKLLLHPAHSEIYKLRQKYNRNSEENKIIKKLAYVSQPMMSTMPNGDVRFLFYLNHEKLVRDFSDYGRLFNTADKAAQFKILQNSPITSLKVFRHRVIGGVHREEVRLSDEYEGRTELIAMSGEETRGQFHRRQQERPKDPRDAESEKVIIGGIREIEMSGITSRNMRAFGVSDYEASSKGAGFYTYSIEVKLEDGTISFVHDELQKLVSARRQLKEFYNRVSRYENLDRSTGRLNRDFIKKIQNEYITPEMKQILENNKRTRSNLVQSSLAKSPWLNAIATYADVLNNLTSIQVNVIKRLASLLYNLADPATGSITGMKTLLEMLENLESKVKGRLGGSHRMLDEVDFNARTPAFKGRAINNLIHFDKHFTKDVHDANTPGFMGYEFLRFTNRNIGLRTITADALKKRFESEHKKYFGKAIGAETPGEATAGEGDTEDFTKFIDLNDTYYSYLTPEKISFGKNKEIELSHAATKKDPKYYDLVTTRTIIAKTDGTSSPYSISRNKSSSLTSRYNLKPVPFAPPLIDKTSGISVEDTNINLYDSIFMTELGISISTPAQWAAEVSYEQDIYGAEEDQEDMAIPEDLMGEDTKFATDRIETEEQSILEIIQDPKEDNSAFARGLTSALVDSNRDLFTQGGIKSIAEMDPRNENNIIDEHFASMVAGESKKSAYLQELPNQIKSIFLGHTSDTIVDWFDMRQTTGEDLIGSPRQASLLYYNFKHLNKIEILVGFETSADGEMQISKPKFQRLSKEIFESILNQDRTVLARMVSRSFPTIGFNKSSKLDLPEFNQFFIISPRTSSPGEETTDEASPELDTQALNEPGQTDREAIQEGFYFGRMTEYSDMNKTGTEILRLLIRKATKQDDLPAEFINTAFLQQSRNVTRVGSKFGSGVVPPGRPPQRGSLNRGLSRSRRGSRRGSSRYTGGGS
jgi:hypothetical protein